MQQDQSCASRIINLTPFTIKIAMPDGTTQDFPSYGIAHAIEHVTSGTPIEVADFSRRVPIPTVCVSYHGTIDLPAPMPGTWYIVSTRVAEAAYHAGRSTEDLLTPGTHVRDEAGKIAAPAARRQYLQRLRGMPPVEQPPTGIYRARVSRRLLRILVDDAPDGVRR